jgi:hypothetical protein
MPNDTWTAALLLLGGGAALIGVGYLVLRWYAKQDRDRGGN